MEGSDVPFQMFTSSESLFTALDIADKGFDNLARFS